MRLPLWSLGLAGAAWAAIAACATGTEDPSAGLDAGFGEIDAGSDVAPLDAAPEATPDARADAGPCVCGAPNCGTCPTALMITVGGYKIDSIEVTNAAYAAFLATNPTSPDAPGCAGNTLTPSAGWPASGKDAHPVVHVDWCDAVAYCRWAGKRLCGAVGDAGLGYSDFQDPQKSAWFNACSAGGTRTYPYGATYVGSKCNDANRAKGTTAAASESPDCVGGYPGLFDMSGNVWEWEDACQGAGATDNCRMRGGAFNSGAQALNCAAEGALPRNNGAPSVGFRCCSL